MVRIQRNGPSLISIPNLKRIAQFVQKLLRGPKIWKLGHVIRPRPLKVCCMIRTQGVSVLYVCTKFQMDSSFRSKVIRGSQNFKIGSRDPDKAHLWVILYSLRRTGPSSIPIPNMKRIVQFLKS